MAKAKKTIAKKTVKKTEDVTDKGSPNLPKENTNLDDLFKGEDSVVTEKEEVEEKAPKSEKPEPDEKPKEKGENQGPGPIETETESLANKDLVDEIVRLRLNADKTLQLTSRFYRKTDNAVERLFIAKAWMGKLLGETGRKKNPYIVNKKIERPADIPKTANVYYLSFNEKQAFDNLNEIDRVLSLRDDIERLIQDLDAIDFIESVNDKRKASIAATQAYVHLSEARFELGNKLAKIREQ